MQGASPLASLGLNPGGTGEGGEPRARRGACPVGRPLNLPLACFSAPIPPTPFPAGRGRPKFFYARGFAPCIPGAEPGRHWGRGRTTRPAGGVPGWLPAKPPFSLLFCPHPPAPLPGGKGETFCLFRRGLPPPAPLRLNPYGAGSTFGKQFLSVMPKTFPFNNIIEKSSGGSGGLFQESPSVF